MSKTVLRLRALMSRWLTFALHSVSSSKNVQRPVPGLQRKSPPWAHKRVPSCSFPTGSHLCARTQKKHTGLKQASMFLQLNDFLRWLQQVLFPSGPSTTTDNLLVYLISDTNLYSSHFTAKPEKILHIPWSNWIFYTVSVVMELFRFIYKAAVVIWQLKNKLEATQKHGTFLTGRWIEKIFLKTPKSFVPCCPVWACQFPLSACSKSRSYYTGGRSSCWAGLHSSSSS